MINSGITHRVVRTLKSIRSGYRLVFVKESENLVKDRRDITESIPQNKIVNHVPYHHIPSVGMSKRTPRAVTTPENIQLRASHLGEEKTFE
jgi:hypothetical protein